MTKELEILYETNIPKKETEKYGDFYSEYNIYGDHYKILESPKHPVGMVVYFSNKKLGKEGYSTDTMLPLVKHLYEEIKKYDAFIRHLGHTYDEVEEFRVENE